MKKFLINAGIVILQCIVGVALLLFVLWYATSAEVWYAGSSNYEQMMEKADTPAELEKEGGTE